MDWELFLIEKNEQEYYLENKERIDKNHKNYDLKRKIQSNWILVLKSIKSRCNNFHNIAYKYYGQRGIQCHITEEEIKFLWFRDKAYIMKKPSIDRIDDDGNYDINNCRFIELSENSKRIGLQRNKQGQFIKKVLTL